MARALPGFLLVAAVFSTGPGLLAQAKPAAIPNWQLAEKFSSTRLRKFVYSTSIRPSWIGKTDRFWYSYRTSKGTRYWVVDAKARTKRLLFDHDRLAAELSAATQKAQIAHSLTLSGLKVDR